MALYSIQGRIHRLLLSDQWFTMKVSKASFEPLFWQVAYLRVSVSRPCFACLLLLHMAQEGHCGEDQGLQGFHAKTVKLLESSGVMKLGSNGLNLTEKGSISSAAIQ